MKGRKAPRTSLGSTRRTGSEWSPSGSGAAWGQTDWRVTPEMGRLGREIAQPPSLSQRAVPLSALWHRAIGRSSGSGIRPSGLPLLCSEEPRDSARAQRPGCWELSHT